MPFAVIAMLGDMEVHGNGSGCVFCAATMAFVSRAYEPDA